MIGETIGNFKIVSRLGRGGMGEVWLAEQQNIGTRVAIKMLQPQVSQDTEHVQRFFNEARAVSRIQHSGIVKIFDVGHHGDRAYLIMEYLEGETLAARIARVGRLPIPEISDFGRQIASVLDATHSAGITHRDLKPENVFLVADRELARGERVKILDFGIAKLTGTLAGASPRTIGTMGTPAYMAPEQWGDASRVDWRADLYSLGCVAFEMTCGRPPFIVTNIAEACAKHLHDPPPHATSLVPEVPQRLDALLDRLLAKDPAARPPSMRDVAKAFETIDVQSLGLAETMAMPAQTAATPVATTLTHAAGSSNTARPTTSRKRRAPIAIAAAVGMLAVGTGVYWVTHRPEAIVGKDAATPGDAASADAPFDAPVDAPADAASPDASLDKEVAKKPPKPTPKPPTPKPPTPPPKPPPPPKPTEGKIDPDAVFAVANAHAKETRRCYETALRDDHALAGKMRVVATIGLDGRITVAKAEGLTDKLQACVIEQLRALQFPKPTGAPVEVAFPFTFEPQPPPPPSPTLPSQADTDHIIKVIQALNFKDCGFKGTFQLVVHVLPDGHVKNVDVPAQVKPDMKKCIAKLVRGQTFEKSEKGAMVSVPLDIK